MESTRANFLTAAGGAAAALSMGPLAAGAQSLRRIDVHHHYAAPEWSTARAAHGTLPGLWKSWTPAKSLDQMDRNGVQTAFVSITNPGVWFGDNAEARKIARACNEYAARLVADHPGRFGFFVVLPLPDVEGALAELAYGLDTLKADGVGLLTNYNDKWLGDPMYDPVFAELDRRRSLVFVHPTETKCCSNVEPEIGPSAIDYQTDTTRAIARFVFTGSSVRYSNLRIIWSHAGGTMPFLNWRFVQMAQEPRFAKLLPSGFLYEARKFYYDTAQTANPAAMAALHKIIPVPHILFGTDYPYLAVEQTVAGLDNCGIYNAGELAAIDRTNALALLPKYRG